MRSDAVNSRFHGVRQQADAVWLRHRWCYWGESGSCVSACRSTSPARQAASSSNGGTRGRPGPVPTSAGRRHAQADFAQADFAAYWFPCAWWGRCALWDRRPGLRRPERRPGQCRGQRPPGRRPRCGPRGGHCPCGRRRPRDCRCPCARRPRCRRCAGRCPCGGNAPARRPCASDAGLSRAGRTGAGGTGVPDAAICRTTWCPAATSSLAAVTPAASCSRRSSRSWPRSTSAMTMPEAPARAVRPERCR